MQLCRRLSQRPVARRLKMTAETFWAETSSCMYHGASVVQTNQHHQLPGLAPQPYGLPTQRLSWWLSHFHVQIKAQHMHDSAAYAGQYWRITRFGMTRYKAFCTLLLSSQFTETPPWIHNTCCECHSEETACNSRNYCASVCICAGS